MSVATSTPEKSGTMQEKKWRVGYEVHSILKFRANDYIVVWLCAYAMAKTRWDSGRI